MVGPGLRPVAFQVFDVEVKALHLGLASVNHVHGARPEADGSQARRRAQAFLAGAVANIDVPVIHAHFVTAQGRYGVHHHQRAVAVGQVNHLLERGEHAGGGLGVDYTHGLDVGVLVQLLGQGGRVRGLAPRAVNHVSVGAAAFCNVRQPVPKEAVTANDHGVAPFQDVGAGCFHGAGAGGGQGQGHEVGGVVDLTQHVPNLVHHLEEFRVQVADHGQGHGLEHPRVDAAGARSQQNSGRWLQLAKV